MKYCFIDSAKRAHEKEPFNFYLQIFPFLCHFKTTIQNIKCIIGPSLPLNAKTGLLKQFFLQQHQRKAYLKI